MSAVFPPATCIAMPHLYSVSPGSKGPFGATGKTGATGQQGRQGERGYRGSTGERGAEGSTGPKGTRGVTGATGESHAQWLSTVTGCMLFNPAFLKQQTNSIFYIKTICA